MRSHRMPKDKAVERVVLEAAIETLQAENKELREQINSQSNEVRISREFAMFCLECLDECSHMATQEQIDELGSAIKKAESSE